MKESVLEKRIWQKNPREHLLISIYRALISILILSGSHNNLFAQNNFASSSNYSFFTEEKILKTDTSDSDKSDSFFETFNNWPREKKAVALNAGVVTATLGIGAVTWDYYKTSFKFRNEGWFDPDTNYGGADKMGHAFSGYALASVYDAVYKKFGYSDREANLYGALSSWGLLTLVEVGDGFSQDYGFSIQDETMNTIGVGLSYLRHRYPRLREVFDYRLEWVPSEVFRKGDADPFTDYEGQKYIFAFKPDGILKTDNSLLKAIELDLGFYTRGYDDSTNNHQRYLFYGVGLNMTYVVEQLTGHKLGGIFDYIQVPFTYIPFKHKLD